jgi:glutathione S-transferase
MAAKKKTKAKSKPRRPKKLVASARIKAAAKKSAARAAKGAPIRKAKAPKTVARKADTSRFVLHGFFMSLPSSKVGLMLSMSGAKWDYRHLDLFKGAQKSPQFQAMNRFGQAPVLEHAGRFLCQSNAILQYLAEQTGRFGGRNETEKLRIAEWLAWDFAEMAVGVGHTRGTKFFPQHEEVVKYLRQRGEKALKLLDRHLGTSKFLVGAQPTIADIAVFPWVATADEGGFVIADYPNVHAWAERMLTHPGAGHPYAIMPKEDRAAA